MNESEEERRFRSRESEKKHSKFIGSTNILRVYVNMSLVFNQ